MKINNFHSNPMDIHRNISDIYGFERNYNRFIQNQISGMIFVDKKEKKEKSSKL